MTKHLDGVSRASKIAIAFLLLACGSDSSRGRGEPRPAVPAVPRAVASDAKPNVVIILADDLGYADLGVQGSTDIPTPNIDRIAKEGARFTNAYSVSPLCSPSRAGLLTGRYPERWGHEFNPGPERQSRDFGIPSDVPTLAELLRGEGYATGVVGKWHLGFSPENLPLARGFDEFFGFVGATHSYRASLIQFRGALMRGNARAREHTYLTDAITRESVDFIRRHQSAPFFLYVPYSAVHAPLEPDRARLQRLSTIADPDRRAYAATLLAMDDGVGQILDALSAPGVADRTIVLFMNDNGGATMSVKASNGSLSGLKGLVNEGGVRVPMLMRWPRHIQPATVVDAPVSSLDVVPTVLAAVGAKPAVSFDGLSVSPLWECPSETPAPRRLYWRLGDMSAVRDGDWKLVQYAGEPVRLYDLQHDMGEHQNLAAQNPEVVARLQRDYEGWARPLMAPRWGEAEHIVRPPDETGSPAKKR